MYLYDGKFTMNSGEISGNTADKFGCCVFMDNSSKNGGGEMTLNGKVIITSNKKFGNNESNVYLRTGKWITIGQNFSTNNEIGIHPEKEIKCTEFVTATKFDNDVPKTDISGSFKEDIIGQKIRYKNDEVQLEVVHDFSTTWSHDGEKHWHECTKCHIKIDEAAHNWGTAITNPTCLDDGSTMDKCTVCAKEKNPVKIDATGHDYGGWKITKKPTLTEKGIETRICKNDSSHVETREIPKLSSDNSNDNSESDVDDNSESSVDNSSESSDNSIGNNHGNTPINPPTGIAISLIPLTAIITVFTVTMKRNKK